MMHQLRDVVIINGGAFNDARGQLNYVNDFKFEKVKRFYQIVHTDISVIRAWQGHQIEHKYFYVSTGAFLLAWVLIDEWNNPSQNLEAEYQIFKASEPQILSIPPGYANGILALEPQSSLLVFSDTFLEESSKDRWTFPTEWWLNWKQISQNILASKSK
jgi:dTDP-4-dehydrorhamnose 3,5-epimerase-like enzyme